MSDPINITDMCYPGYSSMTDSWRRYRLTMEGGQKFALHFLQQYSRREDRADFLFRRSMCPSASFAKAVILEIRNSIFQRLRDVVRQGGSSAYQAAVAGLNGGVDRRGSTMNSFLGIKVLTDLLSMGKCGVFVDNAANLGPRMADTLGTQPYLYSYPVEDIFNYTCNKPEEPSQFQALLLRDKVLTYDSLTNLPIDTDERFRRFWIGDDGYVRVQFTAKDGSPIDANGRPSGPLKLNLTRIPFVLLDLGDSLLKDVVDHQITLLNLVSSDVSYSLKSNFPFLVKQADLRAAGGHLHQEDTTGTATAGGQGASGVDTKVGTAHGMVYDLNSNQPAFINPSAEPLRVSMELRENLKQEIRELVNLAVMTLATRASAESKQMDNQGLEGGLSYIGLVLENGERQIADYWAAYEGSTETPTIKYPDRYSLKTDADRIDESEKLSKLMNSVPGQTVKREIGKNIVQALLGGKVSVETIDKINREIDEAPYTTSDPATIQLAVQTGLVTADTGSLALGFNKGEAELAKKEHAERLATIAASQGINPAARGVKDLAADPNAAASEKAASRNTDRNGTTEQPVRGEAA